MCQYRIVDYSIDNLCQIISDENRISISSLKQKLHIVYLESYFNELNAKTIVVEKDYIDKDYSEDYAAYYARSFKPYKRTCVRLHFFSRRFDKSSFEPILTNNSEIELTNDYVGFIVVKPLPQTILGRTCLRTYPNVGARFFNFIRPYKVNLYGLELSVDSIAYQEQDSIVAACASSAIWSAFQATGLLFQHSIPSPVEITKAATIHFPYANRHFPNKGLNSEQMAHAIRNVGLDPFLITAVNYDIIKATTYAYQRAKIPMVLGFMLSNFVKGIDIGRHAVTITGYRMGVNRSGFVGQDFYLKSSKIEKLYCHDDQVGPFARMEFSRADNRLTTSWMDESKYIGNIVAKPEIIIIPLYHKIRIPFEIILNIVYRIDGLFKLIKTNVAFNNGLNINEIEWDIFLNSNNDFKSEIRLSGELNEADKLVVLTNGLPKYIWRAIGSIDDEKIEFIFDATDIEQGEIFIRLVPYSQNLTLLMKTIANNINIDDIESIQLAKIFRALRS
jgi:hypothetical protein